MAKGKASSQKFIARNRAPRVQIEYDLELYGDVDGNITYVPWLDAAPPGGNCNQFGGDYATLSATDVTTWCRSDASTTRAMAVTSRSWRENAAIRRAASGGFDTTSSNSRYNMRAAGSRRRSRTVMLSISFAGRSIRQPPRALPHSYVQSRQRHDGLFSETTQPPSTILACLASSMWRR